MKDLVAKRYVKALVDGRDLNSVALISEKLNEVSKAFKSDKFNSILSSSDINEVEKTKFIYTILTTYHYLALFHRLSLIRSHHVKISIYFTG